MLIRTLSDLTLDRFTLDKFTLDKMTLDNTPFSKITNFYNLGTENVSWVNGWTSGVATTRAKNADNLQISTTTANGGAAFVTSALIDFTNIDTLYVDWEFVNTVGSGQMSVRVGAVQNDTSNIAMLNKTLPFARVTETLDVSSLSGNYYVKFLIAASDANPINYSGKLYRLWGE